MAEPLFSLDQAMAAQRRLRALLDLAEETFPLPALIGMVSDEIEQMRASGRSDVDTARVLSEATGVAIGVDDVCRHYAPPGARQRG
jgi:hypothetical protein